jgi:hypothetical protein
MKKTKRVRNKSDSKRITKMKSSCLPSNGYEPQRENYGYFTNVLDPKEEMKEDKDFMSSLFDKGVNYED